MPKLQAISSVRESFTRFTGSLLKRPLKPHQIVIPLVLVAAIGSIVAGVFLVKAKQDNPMRAKPKMTAKAPAKKALKTADATGKENADAETGTGHGKDATDTAGTEAKKRSPLTPEGARIALADEANDSEGSGSGSDGSNGAGGSTSPGGSGGTGSGGGGTKTPTKPLPPLDPLMKDAIRKAVILALTQQAAQDKSGPVDVAAVDKALNALRVKSLKRQGKLVTLVVTGGQIKQATIILRETGNHYTVVSLEGYSLK
ncbi:MAG: hypothetical protein C4521_08260 [Actinobacteria bacterium]|nr:MAG: hypothetical protein C4521_08260 [Actinomycetota bacterium]